MFEPNQTELGVLGSVRKLNVKREKYIRFDRQIRSIEERS